jgi:GxxExxY protein
MSENELAKVALDAAFRVHANLGAGLLESVYEVVLAHEMRKAGATETDVACVRWHSIR